ncbi:MAG: Glu-tRNA(Gln) amidotransferase subunit GatE [Bacteroidota bacterium]|nr:Glu-tRNA(Gln) amidotransferase subunit GatE [Bacteroidota bacterium]MDP4190110.1 Glu-tRNA(Gln) amidotransferase subunit GatE [Bacteroidota bacterium]MDP4193725.1 Glu-tRNA(Gln) amidotransferase subunit GatE [Bacteroidota bacterium]
MDDFTFKPFSEMTDKDYELIGFKSGLEIHQQLLTSKKLFCRCPAGIYSTKYNAEILRHMRPTLSEFGEYDGTALMEFKTKKEIIYQINRETVCTYEMDDTPPFEINEEALDIALQTGMLYNCNIVDEIHISRKQYLDGSIPTGFQRTSIFALDGRIPFKDREINIIQMSIEEDACREVSDIGHRRVYLTDRLGMPLIETVTAPEMRTPYEVAEVAQICRKLVRSTGKVRTGIGAARQDVNVSVKGGTRVEIKGVHKIPLIPLLTYNEAMRQWNLLRLRDELKRRGITPESFSAKVEDITRLMKKTYYMPLQTAASQGMIIKCVVLKGFRGLLHWETQTDTYFSKEISDRVRVVACLTHIPNIIHSDSKGDNITSSEWLKIKKAAGAMDDDTLVVVWGSDKDIDTAAKEIIIRAREATIGVPSETRQALKDGTNGFERILPGPDRMYPDTDLPPRKITEERLKKLSLDMPVQFWIREKWYRELNIPQDTVEPLAISKFAGLFENMVKEKNVSPIVASIAFIQYPKRLKREGFKTDILTPEVMQKIFEAYTLGLLSREGILPAMKKAIRNGSFSSEMLEAVCTEEELSSAIKSSHSELERINLRNPEKKDEVLIGLVMRKVRGRISSAQILKSLRSTYKREGIDVI